MLRRSLSTTSITFCLALLLAACAKEEKKTEPVADPCAQTVPVVSAESDHVSPTSTAQRVGQIYFDSALNSRDRGAFVAALDYLDRHDLSNADPLLRSYMHLPRVDGASIRSWLEDRAQYVVTADTDGAKITTLRSNYAYENPGRLPEVIKNGTAECNKLQVVMLNIGSLLYLHGKKNGELGGFKADGLGTIPITSPRSGILMMGQGFYFFPADETALVKIFHLTTLIHESRHSDGNRETTAFLHTKCVGGQYDGVYQCDGNTNGPFGIEALAIKSLYATCDECTTRGKTAVENLYYDAQSRLEHGNATSNWDDTPEGHR